MQRNDWFRVLNGGTPIGSSFRAGDIVRYTGESRRSRHYRELTIYKFRIYSRRGHGAGNTQWLAREQVAPCLAYDDQIFVYGSKSDG